MEIKITTIIFLIKAHAEVNQSLNDNWLTETVGNPLIVNETKEESEKSTTLVVFTYLQTILTAIGLIANLVALMTLTLNGKVFPPISCLLLQHQAVADSFVCIMAIGMYTQPFMWMTGNGTFDFLLCQVWHGQAIYWGGVLLSVWNLVFIAVERFVMVIYPFKGELMRPVHIYVAFIVMYAFSVIFVGPGYVQIKYAKETGTCVGEYYFDTQVFQKFMVGFKIFWFFISYVIPIVFFAVLYSKIVWTLRQRQRALEGMQQHSRIIDIAEQQLTRTAIAVAVVFTICLSWDAWIYMLDGVGVTSYGHHTPVQVFRLFLVTVNSCANPFIYSASLPIFRKSLKQTLRWGNSRDHGEPRNAKTKQ